VIQSVWRKERKKHVVTLLLNGVVFHYSKTLTLFLCLNIKNSFILKQAPPKHKSCILSKP